MLGKLFGSNSRVKILKLFLTHPESKFYVREVSRLLDLQINSARRELENLSHFGLLMVCSENGEKEEKKIDAVSRRKKKASSLPEKKYYKASGDFILFEEIRALVLKAQVLYERDFVEKLRKIGKPKLLILTGFFVDEPEAKTDILIVGRIEKEKLSDLIGSLERELGREVNYSLMDNEEFRYRKDITDIFLFDILEKKKIVAIDELGIG